MDPNLPTSRPEMCPECGAAFSGEGTYCWLCGWKLGDPLVAPRKGPPRVNPYVSPAPSPADLKWTFSISTMFLWTALVAVVMGVIHIAPGLGIPLAIFSLPAALHATTAVGRRRRRLGRALTVPEKIAAFAESFAWVLTVTFAVALAAMGGMFVTCVGSMGGMVVGGQRPFFAIAGTLAGIAAGVAFFVYTVYLFIRSVSQFKD